MDDLNRGKLYESNGRWQIELCDDYEHIDENIEYVVENVLQTTNTESASYRTLYEQFNSFIASKCGCTVDAATATTSVSDETSILCSRNDCVHGGNYVIHEDISSKRRELILYKDRRSCDVIYECSEFCSCSQNCHNRLVQYGPRANLQIENYSHIGKQYGLKTTQSIPMGSFICEYSGEILCKEEAIERYRTNDLGQRMNYIICLNERPIANALNNTQEIIQTFIDPSRVGNIGRYLNHSCDPNCEIISVRVDNLIPKLCMCLKNEVLHEFNRNIEIELKLFLKF